MLGDAALDARLLSSCSLSPHICFPLPRCQDWVVVNLPCELFVEHSDTIVAASPFTNTALSTLAGEAPSNPRLPPSNLRPPPSNCAPH